MGAIHLAASRGQIQRLQELLEKGVDVNSLREDCLGETPLHVAIAQCQLEAVKLLLRYKANIYLCSDSGDNSLLLAIEQIQIHPEKLDDYCQIIEILLSHEKQLRLAYPMEFEGKSTLLFMKKEGVTTLEFIKQFLDKTLVSKLLAIFEKINSETKVNSEPTSKVIQSHPAPVSDTFGIRRRKESHSSSSSNEDLNKSDKEIYTSDEEENNKYLKPKANKTSSRFWSTLKNIVFNKSETVTEEKQELLSESKNKILK